MNHSDTELGRRFLLEPTNQRCALIEKRYIEFIFLQTFPFFSFSSFSQESKSSGGSIIVASRLSPSIFYHVPSAKLNHLKIHYALSRGERERERKKQREKDENGSKGLDDSGDEQQRASGGLPARSCVN